MRERGIHDAAAAIEKIRKLRVWSDRAKPAGEAVGALRDRLEVEVKQTGGMGEVWRTVAPDHLRSRTRVRSFKRGVLTIEAPDASSRYLVDQWLRGGGREMLVGCAPATMKRVVVRTP
jgi:hypothetical protein